MKISRREFFASAGAATLAFGGLQRAAARQTPPAFDEGIYGPLLKDPKEIFDLPRGFSYDVFSRAGERMDDGFLVPGGQDGMAAFRAGAGGRTILIRNHELTVEALSRGPFGDRNELLARVPAGRMYDRGRSVKPCLGGTTTLVYDTNTKKLEKHFLSLAGTIRNCSGGATPWGTWISCEENVQRVVDNYERDHGYCFEVRATDTVGLSEPLPLKAMGRFYHEGAAVDAETSIVYMTEDHDDGLLYRFVPDRPRDLRSGRLQALEIRGMEKVDTSNWTGQTIKAGQRMVADWVDLKDVEAPEDDLRFQGLEAGAARFSRGEGMWAAKDVIYFTCTSGGPAKGGQVWRYMPRTSTLELFIEPNDRLRFDMGDNLTLAPWGDLFICEDGPNGNGLLGLTPRGQVYRFGRNALNTSELAGSCFSPDGATLFLNIFTPGMTLAITGPWNRGSS
jgi:secreted PhoX family phosphatase